MERLPSLFVSHGAPTFALEPGLIGPQLTALGQVLLRPAAVLVVSPHWMTREPRVMTTARPRTMHDFGGFDSALYEITYPVDGSPKLAARAIEILRTAGWRAADERDRGLDHGAWVPLTYLYPRADVPVFQISIPAHLDATSGFEYGRALAPLAGEGVLAWARAVSRTTGPSIVPNTVAGRPMRRSSHAGSAPEKKGIVNLR